jgi:alpha-galactosidase-like protein
MTGRLSWVVLSLLALSGALASAAAQPASSSELPRALRSVNAVAWRSTEGDSAGARSIVFPPANASGAPRSYQVISIDIPDALAHATNIQMEIVAHGDFVILGAHTRSLPASTRTKVGVTVGIPANAMAGRLVAADVRFSSPGNPVMIVPVEIDVSLVRQVALRLGSAPLNAQAGSDVIVPFEISNAGNAKENLGVELTLPSGWSSRDLHTSTVSLEPGETIKKRVRLAVPALSSTGSSFVEVKVRSGEQVMGDETKTVEVFNSSSVGGQAGPLVTTAIAHANDENGRPNTLFTMSATGALFDSVRIDARMSHGSALGGAASSAFSHLGTYQSAASLSFTSPTAQLNFGNTGTSFSDLTGLYPYGQGTLLRLQHPGWSLTSLGALSVAQPGVSDRKPMIGILGERRFGEKMLSTSVTHLADAGASPRKLDAVGIGAAIPAIFGTTLKAEVAERRFQDGSGLGWSTGLVRTGPERNEELRITHAPGGSDAFARATNEVVGNLSEQLTSRASMSATGWRTTDATSVFTGLTARGFSLRPQYAILPSTTVSVEARTYDFDAQSRATTSNAAGGFGNREQQLGFGVSTYVRQYYLNTSAYLGNVTRTVSPLAQAVITDRTPRNYWTTNAGWTGSGGVVEVQSRVEQTRDRGGFVNQQTMFGIRGEQVVIPRLGGVRAEGELQHVSGFGDERSSIVRAGLAVPVMNGVALKMDVERNSIFHSLSGRVPWILGIRFEHALTAPMLRQPGTSGYVYEDRNGNQRRDPGEPGVSGVVVRRGTESAVADASGKYRVAGDATKPVMIDEASLPDGWTVSAARAGDLGISLTTAAEIELVVAARSGIAAVQVDLSDTHIVARDSSGREWMARMTGPTTATFESLPVGKYTLEFDLSDLSEPLVPRAPVPILLVTGKDSKSITITLDPRPIRIWKAPSLQGAPKGTAPSRGPTTTSAAQSKS